GAARGPDVDAGAEVRERRAGDGVGVGAARVAGVGQRADGDRGGGASRRAGAGVCVGVAGGDRERDAAVDGGGHGVIERRRNATAEAHVGHAALGHAAVVGHVVDAGDDTRVGAAAVAAQDAHRDEGRGARHAEAGPGGRRRYVGAVVVAVGGATAVVDRGEAARRVHASTELGVGGADAGVHDVNEDACTVA